MALLHQSSSSSQLLASNFMAIKPHDILTNPKFTHPFARTKASWSELAGVLVFSAIPFTAVKAIANSPLGESLQRRMEERKKIEVANAFEFKKLSQKARMDRPMPLEIHIQGVSIASSEARMQAMTKPTYTAIIQHAKNGKPAVLFVPTRKHSWLTAVDLMTYSSREGGENPMFVLQSSAELEPFVDRIRESMLRERLQYYGVGYLQEGLSPTDQDIVRTLFETGWIQVCVMTSSMCSGMPLCAHLVIIMGRQYYDVRENAHRDYQVTVILQMMDQASHPLVYNADVVVQVITSKQDAVDYLTWTLRKLTQNPSYYNLQGVGQRHLSEHLSELVENTLSDLETRKCVAMEEDDMYLSPLNLGRIASYYYISYTTIERFSSSLTVKTKLKGLLEILASASEFKELSLRPGEEELIRRLINHQRFSFDHPICKGPHVKENALLQAHFSRQLLGWNLAADQKEGLLSASMLFQSDG